MHLCTYRSHLEMCEHEGWTCKRSSKLWWTAISSRRVSNQLPEYMPWILGGHQRICSRLPEAAEWPWKWRKGGAQSACLRFSPKSFTQPPKAPPLGQHLLIQYLLWLPLLQPAICPSLRSRILRGMCSWLWPTWRSSEFNYLHPWGLSAMWRGLSDQWLALENSSETEVGWCASFVAWWRWSSRSCWTGNFKATRERNRTKCSYNGLLWSHCGD